MSYELTFIQILYCLVCMLGCFPVKSWQTGERCNNNYFFLFCNSMQNHFLPSHLYRHHQPHFKYHSTNNFQCDENLIWEDAWKEWSVCYIMALSCSFFHAFILVLVWNEYVYFSCWMHVFDVSTLNSYMFTVFFSYEKFIQCFSLKSDFF